MKMNNYTEWSWILVQIRNVKTRDFIEIEVNLDNNIHRAYFVESNQYILSLEYRPPDNWVERNPFLEFMDNLIRF